MEPVIERLKAALQLESDSVVFTHEDADYFYFRLSDSGLSPFEGDARVGKESYDGWHSVEFRSEASPAYWDGGMLKV